MQRVEIIVKGEVQRVGYRDRIEKIAANIGVTGFVENVKPRDVKIVVEGEEEKIKKFIEKIKINEYPVDVKEINVSYEEPTNEFKYFEIKRGDWKEELGERFDVAGALLYKSVALGEKSVALGEKSVALGEKSVALSEKMLEKQDMTISEIKTVGNRVDNLTSVTQNNFDVLNIKYDIISQTMNKIFEELIKEREETKKELIKEREESRKSVERLVEAILKGKDNKNQQI